MANYFLGEAHNAKVTVAFKDLTPVKKRLSILLFVLWHQRGMLIAGGIAFLAVSLLAFAMAAAALTLF